MITVATACVVLPFKQAFVRVFMPVSIESSQSLWRQETLYFGRSGATLALNQLLQIARPYVTMTMIGGLGVDALAAGSLVTSIGLLLYVTTLGVLQGLVPLVSISIGAGDDEAAARAIRGGLALAVMMGIGNTMVMAAVPWCLDRAGQDPALVALTQRFILALLPGYLASSLGIALRSFLIAANDLNWLVPVMVAGTAFNVACNFFLAGGAFGLHGLTAIGIALSLTIWLMFGLLVLAMWRSRRIPKGVLDRRGGLVVRDILALGIPVGAIFFTEALLFTGSSVLMGYFGQVSLAAHGIVLLWLNIALMIPIGISQAAMARVAFLLGQQDIDAIKRAVVVSLVIGSAASIAIGALLVANSDSLVRLVMWSRSTTGEAVVQTARGFFWFCAFTQLLSGLVIIMASILRGLRDANVVLWLVMLGYWGVGLGGAILLAFGFSLGGTGIWIGISMAFVFAVALLAVRFRRVFARFGRGGECA
jgi:MATE family multidrug resistance protein